MIDCLASSERIREVTSESAQKLGFRPRVLLIAEAANPEWVSVPLEGWSHSRAIASLASGLLVTQVRNREAILRTGLIEGRDFVSIDSEAVARPLMRFARSIRGGTNKGWTTLTAFSALSYYYFEYLVWRLFGKRIRNNEFDLVHRVTPLSPTIPSLLAQKCRGANVPFVIGPLNGGVPWPKGFEFARRKEKEWLSYVRSAYKLMPGYRSTRRCASAILVGSRDTLDQMPEAYRSKCVYVPENAVDPARFTVHNQEPDGLPLRAAFVGRLVPYKGADMLLEAAEPFIRAGRLLIDIIGDGPQMPMLRRFVQQRGLSTAVRLDGWVPHAELQHRLARSHVFAFPSIREFGGAVVLEAMALGLVPIVVDYGGPAELVTDATGYKVPIGSREQIIADFREVLRTIVESPQELAGKRDCSKERVMNLFTWSAKARQTLEVYRWVLGDRRDRPGFDPAIISYA